VKVIFKASVLFAAVIGLAACNGNNSTSMPGTAGQAPFAQSKLQRESLGAKATAACQGSRVGMAQCDALVRSGAGPNFSGLTPANLRSAYKLTATLLATHGAGQIVAVVDACDNPNVASDLATFRAYFPGMPATTLHKYNQTGQQSNYPTCSSGWGVEIDLDVEMVSVSCPNCTIYLVEANSNGWSDLQTAEAEAVTLGATIISNSFGGTGANQAFFSTAHKTYLASAGDSGYGIADPADFDTVVSVGGTTLTAGPPPRHWTETIWSGSGAGCSTDAKPIWQTDPGCANRTANDVSAFANPSPGVAEYDTYGGFSGWIAVGGTSVGTPLLAGIFGLKGNSTVQKGGRTFWNPAHQVHLYPILAGNDGACGGSYLCTAGTGQHGSYSGPGGWGSPKGMNAF
jgi:subtilase family serine protease